MAAPEQLVPRRIPSQNIVSRLAARQMFGATYRRNSLNTVRGFHTNIFPDFTLVNVEKPPCFLRKFSPDGKRFIAFSADQTSLEIYAYQGPAAAADLLHGVEGEYLSNEESHDNNRIRNVVFNRFFKLRHCVSVSPCSESTNKRLPTEALSTFSSPSSSPNPSSGTYSKR